jgi:hypothetical protein
MTLRAFSLTRQLRDLHGSWLEVGVEKTMNGPRPDPWLFVSAKQ